MRIATRLTLLFFFLTLLVTLSVGWFAVAMSSRSQYATLDGTINAVVDSGLHDPNTALSNALYVVQRDGYDLTLDVVFPSGEVTEVNTPTAPLVRLPTIKDVNATLGAVRTVDNLPGFRLRSLNVGGGDYLVVAGSTAGIEKQNQRLAVLVVIATFITALIAVGLARVVMRRDLRSMERLIDYAGAVAGGDEVSALPDGATSRDFQELRAALVVMVDALNERIEIEARSTRVMQRFIDDASHELRTPLTVVKGYNDLMASGSATPEQQRRAVDRVRREVERMESLVRDLLLLAEVREVPRHEVAAVDFSALVRTRVTDFAFEHPDRPLTSDVHEGVALRASEEHLERLVGNALTNVHRHTPADAPVRVRLRASTRIVTLTIEDGGPGLPTYGARPQRFQRFDESRSRDTGGSGLGMSIMADVAEALGGSMVAERSELGGLALRFTLPANASEERLT